MRGAVYNSAIPRVSFNTVNRARRWATHTFLFSIPQFFGFVLALVLIAPASDWSVPEQDLARKIAAVTGPGAVALTIENRSSLGRRDQEIVQNGLRSALESLGLRFTKPEQAAATVKISLSENSASYVWGAEIRQGTNEASIVMTAVTRPEGVMAVHDALPMSLRKTSLWKQADRILDVAVLEEGAAPAHIAVLDGEKVSLYRMQNGKWQAEQILNIAHARPWPRDLRGRLVPARDHLLDVYLPGVICRSSSGTPVTLNCGESDDPWPLVASGFSGGTATVFPSAGATVPAASVAPMKAFFAPTRNFFTGALTPGVGKLTTVAKFYSAAALPREKYALWLFAGLDGQVHMTDGITDQGIRLGWGSDLASVHTACGAGWQVLAASSGEGANMVRAYEIPDRDPVAVSGSVDLPGTITAMWTEAKGDPAVVVVKNEAGSYEAFQLAISCGE